MRKILFLLILISLSNIIYAEIPEKYLSLKNNIVNVRYGPGFNYPIKYVYKKKYLPVKVIDQKENFRKIIDLKKNSGWIHISQLTKQNSLIILENKILFKKPSIFSKPIIKLKEGRLLIITKCKYNWCKVKTEKYIGWLNAKNVWGNVD